MKIIQLAVLVAALSSNALVSNGQNDDLYYDPDRRETSETTTRSYSNETSTAYDDQEVTENEDLEYFDEYYYTNRIRRFQRPLSGIDYYDPYYTDLAYVDPWYDPYTAGSWSRWNNWNSLSWGYGGWTPSYYYGWGRPSISLSFGFGWGNPWGWNSGFGFGYNPWNTWGYNPWNRWGYNNYCGWNSYCGNGWGGYYNDWGWNNGGWNRPSNYGPRPLGSGGLTTNDPNRNTGVRPGTGKTGVSRVPNEGTSIGVSPERNDKVTPGRVTRPGSSTEGTSTRPSGVRSSSSDRQPTNVWGKDRNSSTYDDQYRNSGGRSRGSSGAVRGTETESRPRRETPSNNYNNNVRPERNSGSTPRSEQPSRSFDSGRSSGGNSGGNTRSSSPAPSRSSGSSRRGG